jgi:hypothetical protein
MGGEAMEPGGRVNSHLLFISAELPPPHQSTEETRDKCDKFKQRAALGLSAFLATSIREREREREAGRQGHR